MTCNHTNYTQLHKFNTAVIYKCPSCGLIFSDKFLQPVNPKDLYDKYYKNEIAGRPARQSLNVGRPACRSLGVGRFNFGIEYLIRLFRLFRAFKISTIYPGAKSILDIGSGRGFMLYYLKKYFKYTRTAGTQISKNAYEYSKYKLGLEIYDKDLLRLQLDNNSFDIITIWQVLEHVTNPEKYIETSHGLLKKHGKLLIEVPNFNSWTRRLTDSYWLGYDLDYHLTFFTPESLSLMLKKYNFKINTIHTFSLEYSTFTSAQSLISKLTKSNHIFFQYMQGSELSIKVIFHALLFIFLTPFCFLINILLYPSKKGEVLLIISEK